MTTKRLHIHAHKPTVDLNIIAAHLETLEEQAQRLRAQLRIARGTQNVQTSTVHGPFWIGDNGSTEQLLETVIAAISDRPRTLQELIELTGARRNRVSSALVRIQFDHVVKNLGDQRKAIWWCPPGRPSGVHSSKPGPTVKLKIGLGSRVSTDDDGYIGVVTSIAGTTAAPIYTVQTDAGELITPKASELKLTRGRVPGKNYSSKTDR